MIDKSCCTIHILGRENHFWKDLVEFWHWKWTLNIEKCRFSRVLHQTVLQGIKKSSGHVHWDVKSYWSSHDSPWNSTTVPIDCEWLQGRGYQCSCLSLCNKMTIDLISAIGKMTCRYERMINVLDFLLMS